MFWRAQTVEEELTRSSWGQHSINYYDSRVCTVGFGQKDFSREPWDASNSLHPLSSSELAGRETAAR